MQTEIINIHKNYIPKIFWHIFVKHHFSIAVHEYNNSNIKFLIINLLYDQINIIINIHVHVMVCFTVIYHAVHVIQ